MPSGVDNLFSQLDAASVTWQAWNESMDNACDYIEHGFDWSFNVYSSHHNPALYYSRVEGGVYSEEEPPSAECLSRVLSMGSTAPNDTSVFEKAVAEGSVGRFDFIVPNDCENGHDACGTSDPVHQFDDFLAREVPKIEASPAFDSHSAIFIAWDEGADPPFEPRHPLALVTGPLVKAGSYGEPFTHYSLLRTLEDGFGLSHLEKANRATRRSPRSGGRTESSGSGVPRLRRGATPRPAARTRRRVHRLQHVDAVIRSEPGLITAIASPHARGTYGASRKGG